METGKAVAVETALAQAPKRRTRRRWQNGSIYHRGSGFTLVYRMPDGKQKWESGFKTKAAAQTRKDEVLGLVRNGTYVQPEVKLFKHFCAEWLESKKRSRNRRGESLKPSTWRDYNSKIKKWFLPNFGDQFVCDITKRDVIAFFERMKTAKARNRQLTFKTIKNIHAQLHEMFDGAMYLELSDNNPAHGVEPDGGRDSEKRHVPSPMDVLKTLPELSSTYQVMVLTAVLTGLRKGELLGLVWDDIDLENGIIHVRRELQRVHKKLLEENAFTGAERIRIGTVDTGLALLKPKTKNAIRDIEIHSKLTAFLRTLRQGQSGSSPFVFHDELRKPLDPDAVYDVLHSAQDRAGVEHFELHGLRHLHSSKLQELGAPVAHAQERLGHASASTTLNIYTHSVTPAGRKYAKKLESAFPFVSDLLAKPESAGTRQEVTQ